LAVAAKTVLNAPAPVSRHIIGRVIRPGRWFANKHKRHELSDDELLAAAAPMAHPVGTCSIGRADDPMAVVDPSCRVYGLSNLRVVDASVMPRVPSANTNLPTIMVAERAADRVGQRADFAQRPVARADECVRGHGGADELSRSDGHERDAQPQRHRCGPESSRLGGSCFLLQHGH